MSDAKREAEMPFLTLEEFGPTKDLCSISKLPNQEDSGRFFVPMLIIRRDNLLLKHKCAIGSMTERMLPKTNNFRMVSTTAMEAEVSEGRSSRQLQDYCNMISIWNVSSISLVS
jgi:hypothetical protein